MSERIRPARSPRRRSLLSAAALASAAAIFLLDLLGPPGIDVAVGYVVAALIGLALGDRRTVVGLPVLCSLLAIAGLLLSPPGAELPVALANRAISLGAVWAVALVGLRLQGVSTREIDRFRVAVESAPHAVVMVDPDARITLVNSEARALFDYRTEELIGRPVEILVPPRYRDAHPYQRRGFLADPRSRPMGRGRDIHAVRKDGREIPVEIGLNQIHTDRGVAVVSTIVDISERKHAEELLLERTRDLERSNRDFEQFARAVSHDLKAPLRGILALTGWISDDWGKQLDAEGRGSLEAVRSRARRMHRMIDGILEYSRAGRGGARLRAVDPRLLVEDVIASLDPPSGVRVRIEGDFPPLVCDPVPLGQVFQNLIDNAMRHLGRPSGEVTVSCRDAGEALVFAVADDGVGIPPEHHERIFWLFHTLRPPDDEESTGVGLAIVKKIVETHGGEIHVESSPGQGTTFRFTCPKRSSPS